MTENTYSEGALHGQTGRIKSQRQHTATMESRLLKQYDGYNTARVNTLRSKYQGQNAKRQETQISQKGQQPRIPLSTILNTQQNGKSNRIKQNLRAYITEVTKNNLSTKYSVQERQILEENIREFKSQVGVINSGINERLEDLQDRIREYKQKCQRDRQIDLVKKKIRQNQEQRTLQNQYLDQSKSINTEQIRNKSQTRQENDKNYQPDETPYKTIQDYEQCQNLNFQNKEKGFNLLPINEPSIPVEQSYVALKGQIKQGKQFTKEFTYFINRLKDQIKLDRKLTKILLSLRQDSLIRVRKYIQKYYPRTDMSFFEISPIQMDPLKTPTYISVLTAEQIENLSEYCYQLYKKILDHYHNKLHRKYGRETIEMLFEQLDSHEVSIGHIISYINMRTEQEFRNRDLVKLLRRINICSPFISREAFYRSFGILGEQY